MIKSPEQNTIHFYALFCLFNTFNLNKKVDTLHIRTPQPLAKGLKASNSLNNFGYFYYFVIRNQLADSQRRQHEGQGERDGKININKDKRKEVVGEREHE